MTSATECLLLAWLVPALSTAAAVEPSSALKGGLAAAESVKGEEASRLFSSVRLMVDSEIFGAAAHAAWYMNAHWKISGTSEETGQVLDRGYEGTWFRWSDVEDELSSDEDARVIHGLDRLFVEKASRHWKIKAGRQAVGLGRARIFPAYDFLAPFSPVQADQEWRRGVDAFRAEWMATDTWSTELLAAGGRSSGESAAFGRLRGYSGVVDGEVLAGRLCGEDMAAAGVSASFGGAAWIGEAAWTSFAEKDTTVQATLGTAYTFGIGQGLDTAVEYHYNGFGGKDRDAEARRADDKAFTDRMARGGMRTLGRHEAGLQASLPWDSSWAGSVVILVNLVDGSGLASPGVSWISENTLRITVHFAEGWGRPADENGSLESEYGGLGSSLFAQAAFYF